MVERGMGPKSLMERSKGRQELSCCLAVSCLSKTISPLSGVPYPPFYRPRGSRVYRWEKEEKTKVEKVLQGARSSFTHVPCNTSVLSMH